MSISLKALHSLADLAGLKIDNEDNEGLVKEMTAILDFVQQLKEINTDGVAPLFHPLDLQQRFRADEASHTSCLQQLEEIAPLFEDQHYLAPQTIDTRE